MCKKNSVDGNVLVNVIRDGKPMQIKFCEIQGKDVVSGENAGVVALEAAHMHEDGTWYALDVSGARFYPDDFADSDGGDVLVYVVRNNEIPVQMPFSEIKANDIVYGEERVFKAACDACMDDDGDWCVQDTAGNIYAPEDCDDVIVSIDDSDDTIPIFWDDLTPAAQKKIVDAWGCTLNYDIPGIPLFELPANGHDCAGEPCIGCDHRTRCDCSTCDDCDDPDCDGCSCECDADCNDCPCDGDCGPNCPCACDDSDDQAWVPPTWTICMTKNGMFCEQCGKREYPYIDGIGWATTVGLTQYNHAELEFVLDADPEDIVDILNTLGNAVRNGDVFKPGENASIMDEDGEFLVMFAKGSQDNLLRVVVPDSQGRWPEDEGCEYPYNLQNQPISALERNDKHPGNGHHLS